MALKIYSIYLITNLINNKVYIGQTVDHQQRWIQHRFEARKEKPRFVISQAIKKYGDNNFIFEVIASCKTQEDANETETMLIIQYKSHVDTGHGYNVSAGGSNVPKTEDWKKKISATLMGHFVSEETKEKMSAALMGRVVSDTTKQAVSRAQIGNTHRAGLTAWNKGVPMLEERKQKMRKLSPAQELEITNDPRSSRVLAKEYGVNKSTILDIRKRNK